MISQFWNKFIFYPVLTLLALLLQYTGSFSWSLFILSAIIAVITIPFEFSVQKNMRAQRKMAPKLKKLKEKYADNPVKLMQAQKKLNEEHGVSNLGCFTSILITLIIGIVLYQAVKTLMNAATSSQISPGGVIDLNMAGRALSNINVFFLGENLLEQSGIFTLLFAILANIMLSLINTWFVSGAKNAIYSLDQDEKSRAISQLIVAVTAPPLTFLLLKKFSNPILFSGVIVLYLAYRSIVIAIQKLVVYFILESKENK